MPPSILLAASLLSHVSSLTSADLETSQKSNDVHRVHRSAPPPSPVIHGSFGLISLLEVHEARKEIVYSCFLKASWATDDRDADQEDLFAPRVLPADPTRVDLAGFLAPATTVETNGGLFHQVTMATVAQHCQFDYAHFPFDTQTCLIRLRSTSPNARLNVSDVRLEPDFDALQQKFAVRVRQRQPAAAHEQAVELQLRRRIGAHLARLYAPSALLVSASWLAALVPVSLIRSRLPVTILALLTLLLTCGTAQRRGPSSEAPRSAAHAWEIGCLVFSLVSVLEAVLDMRLVVRATGQGGQRWERVERCGARVYFKLYALCWIIFCMVYWLCYVPAWRSISHD